ncbi:ABC-type branched-chain amino acid transport system, periplasmic component [Syntrophobacter sp. SbD1]|nr:ABC-type branched-chain amino acid transport system, periplasmic component [Syntrophobacter sp. SbD1]
MEALNVNSFILRIFAATVIAIALVSTPAAAQKKYDHGATDTEIKIGSITPYTGVFSEYGAVGRAEAAYFQMINDRGGINGRKINFVSVDDGSQVNKSVELAHKLVEQDGVLLIFSSFGSESNIAIRKYMNDKKVQLFIQTSSAAFDDPAHFPWTMGFFATYRTEGLAYANYILQNKPGAKIAVLYANSDAGKEYLAGVHDGLGRMASTMIVKEVSYDNTDATLASQIVALKSSGADVFINLAWGKFATQAIRTTYDVGWHPLQFIPNASLSIAAFLDPAGLEKAAGIITNARSKAWLHPQARSDPAVREFLDWMSKYNPQASLRDQLNVAGYERAQALVEVLKKCGDDLTRANVMKQAASLNLEIGMLRPGIRITTSPTDYQPIKQLYLIKFNGKNWVPLGQVIGIQD